MRKNKMKKVMTALTGIILTISLAACGSQDSESNDPEIRQESENATAESAQESSAYVDEMQNEKEPEKAEEPTQQSGESDTEASAEDTEQTSETGGKTLVVYYSATGNTESVAGYIAAAMDADVFVLEPAEPYSSDDLNWSDENSRVVYEHDNPDARNVELVAASVDEWESYDTVFIGYPNWWYDMPMALYSFFDEYDFSGKTIIPFNVHNGSRFSGTIETIQGLEPEAEVVTDGFTVSERNVAEAKDDVADWLRGLGY